MRHVIFMMVFVFLELLFVCSLIFSFKKFLNKGENNGHKINIKNEGKQILKVPSTVAETRKRRNVL